MKWENDVAFLWQQLLRYAILMKYFSICFYDWMNEITNGNEAGERKIFFSECNFWLIQIFIESWVNWNQFLSFLSILIVPLFLIHLFEHSTNSNWLKSIEFIQSLINFHLTFKSLILALTIIFLKIFSHTKTTLNSL